MAKDLNTSNLNVVSEAGDLKVVREADGQETRLGAVFLDGKRLDGVYCELEAGSLGEFAVNAKTVPAGTKKRDAYLKRWVAAQKSAKAKKGAVSSLLLLSLAACGGGGGPAVVKQASIDPTNGISSVQITGASVGAVVTIASELLPIGWTGSGVN